MVYFFFFNDTATTEIYTLSLHDALPISPRRRRPSHLRPLQRPTRNPRQRLRSEEHTSELQSRLHLVCRLLLEKKNSCGRRAVAVSRSAMTTPSTTVKSSTRDAHPQIAHR